MNSSEKLVFVMSPELSEYLRLCGSNKVEVLREIVEEVIPKDIQSLVKHT